MNNELLRYSLQLSMLSILLSKHLLNDIEYRKIKLKLMKKVQHFNRIIFIMFCECGIIELHREIQKGGGCSEERCKSY